MLLICLMSFSWFGKFAYANSKDMQSYDEQTNTHYVSNDDIIDIKYPYSNKTYATFEGSFVWLYASHPTQGPFSRTAVKLDRPQKFRFQNEVFEIDTIQFWNSEMGFSNLVEGCRIMIYGDIFCAHTMWHITRVLMADTQLQILDNNIIDPEWFKQSSSCYNNDLAKVCGEMSNKIEDSENDIKQYLTQCGFDVNNNFKYYSSNVPMYKDLVSVFAITHKTINIDGQDKTLLFVICRGTKTSFEGIGDWIHGPFWEQTNEIAGNDVFHNVYEFEEHVYDGLVDYANTHNLNNINGDKLKVVVTGHSLGGAVANAVTAKMNYEVGQDSWWLHRINKEDIYSYTFGAIKVLSEDYEDVNISSGYENIHNVYNTCDSFGPKGNKSWTNASSPYQKFGHTEYFDMDKEETGSALWDSNNCHNMPTYIDALNYYAPDNNFIRLSCDRNNYVDNFWSWLFGLFGIKVISE